MGGCPECVAFTHQLAVEAGFLPGRSGASWKDLYDEVFERTLAIVGQEEQRLAVEKLRGWGQWASLEPLAPQARFSIVESDPSYHTWGLYDRLLEASRWYSRTEPAEAVDIVRLAIVVAERLDTSRFSPERIADLQAGAWAALGNARRLASDFDGARRAFNEAWRLLEAGTGDPLERGSLISLESSYIRDLGEFETVVSNLEEALKLYRSIGESHLQGRTLLQMGDAIGHSDPGQGIAYIRQALSLLDPVREPRLELSAQHDLAWFLNDSGRTEEALAVLDRARPLYAEFPDEWTQLRLHWLEGRIARNLGELNQTEHIYAQLWEEFRSRDLHHELVLLSIDLAELLVFKGEINRAAELVEGCYPIMQAWGLHRFALAAWLVFAEALANHQIDSLFERIRDYYRRHWVKPEAFQ
jgi:tetratricopeptide (TPR) repeat protein